MLRFSDINDGIQGENDTDYETECASVEELLNMNRTVTNEATLISGIPNIINKKHFQIWFSNIINWGKESLSILSDKFCEEQGKFCCNVSRDVPISLASYFNQRLLNFNQYFASDLGGIFFAGSVYEQHHLRSSISLLCYKIKPGTLTAGTVEKNLKRTIERFVVRDK